MSRTKSISKQQILSAIRAAARKLGHAPTRSEFMRLSGIHYCKLIPHFAGYRAAVRAAGLKPHPNGVRIDTAAMLRDWGRLARKLGRVPTRDEYERHGRYAFASLETRFRRWSQVRSSFLEFAAAGGLGPAQQWAELVEKIRNGPVPRRGGGRHWRKQLATGLRPEAGRGPEAAMTEVQARLRQDGASAIAIPTDFPAMEETNAAEATAGDGAMRAPLPAPLVGKRCVTATMLAVFVRAVVMSRPESRLEPLPAFFPRRVFPDRPVMGPPLPWSGLAAAAGYWPALVTEPVNEMGVLMLFAGLARRLGFIVEAVQAGYPDCEAKLEVEPGRWQRVRIEFELESRKFRDHRHDPRKCDMIVCWRHNWAGCPKWLQVIELKKEIARIAEIAKE